MDILLYIIGAIFLVVFGFRFIWFLIDFFGRLFWDISGYIILLTGFVIIFVFLSRNGVV